MNQPFSSKEITPGRHQVLYKSDVFLELSIVKKYLDKFVDCFNKAYEFGKNDGYDEANKSTSSPEALCINVSDSVKSAEALRPAS